MSTFDERMENYRKICERREEIKAKRRADREREVYINFDDGGPRN